MAVSVGEIDETIPVLWCGVSGDREMLTFFVLLPCLVKDSSWMSKQVATLETVTWEIFMLKLFVARRIGSTKS